MGKMSNGKMSNGKNAKWDAFILDILNSNNTPSSLDFFKDKLIITFSKKK